MPDEIQELRDRLERLEGERLRLEREQQTLQEMHELPPAPKAQGWAADVQHAQELARHARQEAIAVRDAEFAKHLEKTADKRAKLQERIDQLDAERKAEVQRHAEATREHQHRLQGLDAKTRSLREELNRMETPPDPPAPDYRRANRVAYEANFPAGWSIPEQRQYLTAKLQNARSFRNREAITRIKRELALLDEIERVPA
jgi:hypothetical protein